LGSIALFVRLVERQFGRREALIGGLAFAATPVIGERLLEINIDTAELLLLLGAATCLEIAHRTGRRWLFPLAGALIGVAILCRPTQLALLPIFAAAFWFVPDWRGRAPAFVAGLLAPILTEAAVYAIWAGDALFPWKLSMAHTRIPSTELEATVNLAQSPLFNIAYIDGWKPSMGLSVHWTVDGLLNLLIHPGIGLSIVAALMLIGLDHRRLLSPDPRAKLLLFLIGASMAFFGALVYAFAIDPKPRMFLPVLAVACAAFGYLGAERLRTRDKLLVVACLSLLAVKGVVASWDRLRVDPVAATAAEWVRAEPGAIAATPFAAAILTLTPEVRNLPVGRDARPKLLVLGATDCLTAGRDHPGWRVLREQLYTRHEPQLMAEMRKARLLFQPTQVIALCLLERPAGSAQVGRGRL
jgi:4-amino-4-deoxy-L-arabinose transferase-like glycosyltransferase